MRVGVGETGVACHKIYISIFVIFTATVSTTAKLIFTCLEKLGVDLKLIGNKFIFLTNFSKRLDVGISPRLSQSQGLVAPCISNKEKMFAKK